MRPKGKLFALFAIFAAIGLVTATGAFTSVEATRTADVGVAGDADALLAIEPAEEPGSTAATKNAEDYASVTDGTVQVKLTTTNGNGVNPNAVTDIDQVLNVTNQGSQSANLSITLTDNSGDTEEQGTAETPSNYITVNVTSSDGSKTELTNGGSYELTPGESVFIEITVDTTTISTTNSDFSKTDDLLDEITFVADQT